MSGEAWLSGAWLGAQLPRTHPAQTSISLGIANLITMHSLNTYLNMELDTKYVHIKSTTVYATRRNWDSPNPFLASECSPPPRNRGEGAH